MLFFVYCCGRHPGAEAYGGDAEPLRRLLHELCWHVVEGTVPAGKVASFLEAQKVADSYALQSAVVDSVWVVSASVEWEEKKASATLHSTTTVLGFGRQVYSPSPLA